MVFFGFWGSRLESAHSVHKVKQYTTCPELLGIFQEINQRFFDGFLDAPILIWNSRLRSSAGRFIPGSRKYPQQRAAVIEVASYLKKEKESVRHITDTVAHEMIHYWLWVRRQPYGHTPEFHIKMNAMGVSRYNPVPKTRPLKYLYTCTHCGKEFHTKRRLGTLACAPCCKKYSGGKYDARFLITLKKMLASSE